MKKRTIYNFFKKSVPTLLAVILILVGVCFLDGAISQVSAAETAVLNEDGYYVQKFTQTEFASYRDADGNHTYPKLKVDDGSDLLFAGWFTNEACTASVGEVTEINQDVYAKFVDADLSYIKCQVTPDTDVTSDTTNMRIISALDSNQYSGAGFYVTYKGTKLTGTVNTLYSRLSATDDQMACGYSPVAFNEHGQYFSALLLKNIANKNFAEPFYIQSYWTTLDGTTVLGMSRYVRVEDSYNHVVNVPVRVDADESVTEGNVSVSYDAEKFSYLGYDASVSPVFTDVTVTDNSGTVTIAGSSETAFAPEGLLANLRLQLKADAKLDSVTTFGVTESFENSGTSVTIAVSDVYFKNYPLAYGGTPDTSWYDLFPNETTYVISSAADLYGLATIVNSTDTYSTQQFAYKTVILGADVVINDGTSDITGWTQTDTTETPHEWIPIGYSSSKCFEGTFDGDGHSISGIYFYDDDDTGVYYCGLFGISGTNSVLKNFKIENSYFESAVGWNGDDDSVGSKYAMMGSVVGQLAGDMYNVYSEADLVSVNEQVGGLVGRANPGSASGLFYIDNCWFDGEVQVSRPRLVNQFIGGIVGDMIRGELHITNTLNSGTVTLICTDNDTTATAWNVGGIVGGTETWSTPNLVFENCLNTGVVSIQDGNNNWGIGSIVGRLNDNYTATFTDVYATSESHSKMYDYASKPSTAGTQVAEADITGHVAYDTDVKNLGIYAYGAEDSDKWVITENGTPELKTFSDNAIDVAWYYDNNVESTDAEVIIYTAEQLYGFSAVSQSDTFKGDTVKLGANITLNPGNAAKWSQGIATPERVFTPIATDSNNIMFKGTFDGQGHSIYGLWVNGKNDDADSGNGLFGFVDGGQISNLSLKNSCISSEELWTGSIAGWLKAGTITNVYSDAYVNSTSGQTGGMVGCYKGGTSTDVLAECWFAGNVQSSATKQGGIIGCVDGGENGNILNNCLNTGTVVNTYDTTSDVYVGGLVGYAYGSSLTKGAISNSLQAGSVTSISEGGVGSVVGYIQLGANTYPFTFKNVYTTQALGGNNNSYICGVGNWWNKQTINGAPALISEDDITGENASIYTALEFYDTDSTSNVWGVVSGEMPVIKSLYDGTVMTDLSDDKVATGWYYNEHSFEGTISSQTKPTNLTTQYTVTTPDELYGLAKLVNDNRQSFEGMTVALGTDITLNEGEVKDEEWVPADGIAARQWTPIGDSTNNGFAGTFEGNDHTIEGLYLNDSQTTDVNSGLFGMTTHTSVVRNFYLKNSYFKRSNDNAYMGSVIGLMSGGKLERVYSDATVISNGLQFGGLVGRAEYIPDEKLTTELDKNVYIDNCWFDGYIHATEDSNYDIGGIVGIALQGQKGALKRQSSLEGTINISNCLNSGEITKDGATGATDDTNAQFVGGIIARDNWCKLTMNLTNCLNTGIITVPDTNKKAVGSIIGAAQRPGCVANLTNTVASTESFSVAAATDNTSGTVNGTTYTNTEFDLTGYWGYANLYTSNALNIYTDSNETGTFVIQEDGTPMLKTFADTWLDFGWFYDHRLEGDTFTIDTLDEFYTFRYMVNQDTGFSYKKDSTWYKINGFTGKTIYLGTNLTINEGSADEWAEGQNVPETSWTPIGNFSKQFKGTFDGQGYTISGVYLNAEKDYQGLFGSTGETAAICNLRLENSFFETDRTDYIIMGSIVGIGEGAMTNVYSNAIIHTSAPQVGGLVGRVQRSESDQAVMTMTSCWFDGQIVADIVHNDTDKNVPLIGGLVGVLWSGTLTTDTCLYTGELDMCYTNTDTAAEGRALGVGGFCGDDKGATSTNASSLVVKNSICAGSIDITWKELDGQTPSGFSSVASVVGEATSTTSKIENTVVATTNITTTIEATGEVKNITVAASKFADSELEIPESFDNVITSYSAEDLKGIGTYMLTDLSFEREEEDTTTPIWAAREDKLTAPASLVTDAMTITDYVDTSWYDSSTTEYTLNDKADIYGLSKLSRSNDFAGVTISLADNITFASMEEGTIPAKADVKPENRWYPIGIDEDGKRFAGTFDGSGKTFSGVYAVLAADDLGLFAATEAGSTVKKLRLKDSYLEQTGSGHIGSIISECRGNVENVYSEAILCSKADRVGGIVGSANGYDYNSQKATTPTITDCWFAGTIDLNDSARYGGGIIGCQIQGTWTLSNCLFTGSIDCEYDVYTNNAYLGGMAAEVQAAELGSWIVLDSCVSAGNITTTANVADGGVGALVGVMQAKTVTVNEVTTPHTAIMSRYDVFATRETSAKDVGNWKAVEVDETEYKAGMVKKDDVSNDEVIWTHNADRLIGYCTEDTTTEYTGGNLDFTSDWMIRSKGTPVPAVFADLVEKVETDTLSAAIGLDQWGDTVSLAKTKHHGVGRYVIKPTDGTNNMTYNSYVNYLVETLDFTKRAGGTENSGIYTKEEGDWVLNVVYNPTGTQSVITVHTGIEETLSPNLDSSAVTTTTENAQNMSITMMQLTGTYANNETLGIDSYYYGSSFVIQLPQKGHFIVNDGGNVNDYDGLIAYLKDKAGTVVNEDGTVTNPVVIEAWTVSHQDTDHFCAVEGFVTNPDDVKAVHVEAFYINEPNNRALYHVNGSLEGALEAQYRGVRNCRTSTGEKTPVYWYQTGEKYYFDGITMDVIQSQEQIWVNDYARLSAANGSDTHNDFNTASTVLLFTTSEGKKILIGGDANYVNMDCIMDLYGTDESGYTASSLLQGINIFAAWHHGKNTSYKIDAADVEQANVFTDYLTGSNTFDAVLYPCSIIYGDAYDMSSQGQTGAYPNAGEANTYLQRKTKENASYHYGDGNVTITFE